MKQGLQQLNEVLSRMSFINCPQAPHSSNLLDELIKAPCLETAFSTPSATPLLHNMAAAHGYVIMFVHVCRTGQVSLSTITYYSWFLAVLFLKYLFVYPSPLLHSDSYIVG